MRSLARKFALRFSAALGIVRPNKFVGLCARLAQTLHYGAASFYDVIAFVLLFCRREGGFAQVYVEGRHCGVHALEFARGLQRAVAVDCEHKVGSGVVHQAVAFLPYMMLRFQQ